MNTKQKTKPKCRDTATWIIMYQRYQFQLVCDRHVYRELEDLSDVLSASRVMEYSTKECECYDDN